MPQTDLARRLARDYNAFETGNAFRDSPLLRVRHALQGLLHRARYNSERRKPGIPIIVYQMGKVGSSSVVATLAEHSDRPVFQVHHLSPHGLEHVLHFDGQRGRVPGAHYWNGLLLSREFRRMTGAPMQLDVVTLVRDPVARNVSAFFQSLDRWIGEGPTPSPEGLGEIFLRDYPHDLPLQWFDLELRDQLGVDIRTTALDFTPGWALHRGHHGRVLFLRVEDLQSHGIAALSAFVGQPVRELKKVNEGAARGRGELYRRFLRTVRLPDQYLQRFYDAPITRVFYTESEIRAFRARWSGSTTP